MTADIIKIKQNKVLVKQDSPVFHVSVTDTQNQHRAQAFIDVGDQPGPWLKIGINDTEYGFGYLPDNAAK